MFVTLQPPKNKKKLAQIAHTNTTSMGFIIFYRYVFSIDTRNGVFMRCLFVCLQTRTHTHIYKGALVLYTRIATKPNDHNATTLLLTLKERPVATQAANTHC